MAEALFITAADLKRNTIINGSVDADLFMQYIRISQTIHITHYLGTDLYNRLQAGIIAADLTTVEDTLIQDYIQDALIHLAMAEYLPFASVKVSNGGVFKHIPDNAESVESEEIDRLAQKEKDYADYYLKRLLDYLKFNQSLYPQYTTNTDEDIKPSSIIDYTGGWVL